MKYSELKNDDEAAEEGGLIFPTEKPKIEHRHVAEDENLGLIEPSERASDKKERFAGYLAASMFILLSLEIVTYIVAGFLLNSLGNIDAVYKVVFPVTAGFFGSAVTYYFNMQK